MRALLVSAARSALTRKVIIQGELGSELYVVVSGRAGGSDSVHHHRRCGGGGTCHGNQAWLAHVVQAARL